MSLPIVPSPAHSTNTWSRGGQKIEYIVLHYVGAVSTARNNGAYYGGTPNIGASAHFFVDEHDVVSSVPENLSAGHCGVDYSGGRAPYWGRCRNKNSIGIEMCCKKDPRGNWYIEHETIRKTAALTRDLMAKYNIDADHVVRHYDVCWKTCPEPWVREEQQWKAFKARLTAAESEEEEMVRYQTIADMPGHYRDVARRLIERGALRGRDGGNLDLSEDMLRTMLVCQRMIDGEAGA